MAAKSVAFINFKGGVGKTAMTVNLGAALARHHGRKVLIVDLDPQCNASFWLLQPPHWKLHVGNGVRSTYQIFDDQIVGKFQFDFDKAVVRGVPQSNFPLLPSLDILPASLPLLSIEDRIHQNKYANFFEFVYKALKPFKSQYDYIFFDCPPNTYSVTKNALFAADTYLVPFVPDFLSLSGLQFLTEQVQTFSDKVSGFRQGRKKAQVGMIAISHYKKTNAFDESIEDLHNTIANLRAAGAVHPKCQLLKPFIRNNTHISESTAKHVPVCVHNESCNGTWDYYHLSEAFEKQIGDL